MFKAFLLAVGVATVLSSQASAEVRFRGHVVITAINNCQNGEMQVGWDFRSEFHPRLAGNDDFTGLSLVHDFGAIGNRLQSKDFTSAYQTVIKGGVGWGDGYVPQKKGAILLSTQQPKIISASTQTINVTGKMKNPWGDEGSEQCEATFRGVYVQLVN